MNDIPRGGKIMWAPWRGDYVAREHNDGYSGSNCIFCTLPARDDDASTYVLHRGDLSYVIMNLYPYNNGHLMVVPFDHQESLVQLNAPTLAEMTHLLQKAQIILSEALRPEGFNMGINQGAAAGAGVAEHIHWHLVPRWGGDTNFMPVLDDTRVLPQDLDTTYTLLRPGFDAL